MAGDKKESAFRILALLGLAALLVAVLWAGKKASVEQGPSGAPQPQGRSGSVQYDADTDPGKGEIAREEEPQPSGELLDGVRVVDFEAFRYGFAPDPLVVKAGERVRLKMTSRDVTHWVAIPAIGFSTVVPAEGTGEAEFDAPHEPGEYSIYCTVYCGPGHGDMRGRLVVLPAEAGGSSGGAR